MTNMNNEVMESKEIGWDDEITANSQTEFITLPEGDYIFTVTKLERERFTPSSAASKIPACNKAVLTLEIETPQGNAYIKHNLFLHSITERMLAGYFEGTGQKEPGIPKKPNWNNQVGQMGYAKIKIREYNGNKYNQVAFFHNYDKFLEKKAEEKKAAAPAKSWESGTF